MRTRSERGETLVETLAAILVCAFAITALFAATAVASRLNMQATERASRHAQELAAAEATGSYLERQGDGTLAPSDDVQHQTVTICGTSYDVTLSGGPDVVSWETPEKRGA